MIAELHALRSVNENLARRFRLCRRAMMSRILVAASRHLEKNNPFRGRIRRIRVDVSSSFVGGAGRLQLNSSQGE